MKNKNKSPSKWDMKWKKPRTAKANWKIPTSVWVIIGLLFLFTGITYATSLANSNTPPNATEKKTTHKKFITGAQKQPKNPQSRKTANRQKKKNRDNPNLSITQKKEKTNSEKTPNISDDLDSNPSNPTKPEIKTVYIYKDRPTSNNKKNTPTPKKPIPTKPTTPPTAGTKPKPSSTPIIADPKNILKNPSFENNSKYWMNWSPDGQGSAYDIAKDYPYDGKSDMVHWYDHDYRQLTFQRPKNIPDGIYILKGMVRSSGGQKQLRLGVKESDNTVDDENKYIELNNKADPNTWHEFQVNNIIVKGGTAKVYLFSYSTKGKWADFDNIRFYRVK
ncbi:hypothetical protein [Shimazuella kribbensis]|uniref:hypothetical protein n=1 Tax=Shimazuella kribbensis TaxID=139808 RepID=UPI0004166D1F|nr:hypothetical protein [Shimazuella kribbensis]